MIGDVDESNNAAERAELNQEEASIKTVVQTLMEKPDTKKISGPDSAISGHAAGKDAELLEHLSKNQQKKLKRKQQWEDGREYRKVKRKEKTKERKARKKATFKDARQGGEAGTLQDRDVEATGSLPSHQTLWKGIDSRDSRANTQVPITIIYDCGFDDLMTENERISLGSQLTRAYSDNRKARFRAHIMIASFGGRLKERFEGILGRHHEQWKGINFTEKGYLEATEQAVALMKDDANGGKLAGALARDSGDFQQVADRERDMRASASDNTNRGEGEVVYLTSDSPNTLSRLRPYSTYIIGGLVDKNRHKGICYRKALGSDTKTAKLPIGEFMRMQSRQVLTTNHVGEIMLKWLESGDWGKAFMECIPKRKGGILRNDASDGLEVRQTCDTSGERNRVWDAGEGAGGDNDVSDGESINQ